MIVEGDEVIPRHCTENPRRPTGCWADLGRGGTNLQATREAPVILLLVGLLCCGPACVPTDRAARKASAYPVAVDVLKVGTYSAVTKSGGGYFYDDLLEYRVWVHHAEGGDDDYKAFPTHEEALAFARTQSGAEEPLALVLQREWVEEPQSGEYLRRSDERIAEWQVAWLAANKREAGSIDRFLAEKGGPTMR